MQAVTAERCGLVTAVSCCDSTHALAAAGSDGRIRLYDLRRLEGGGDLAVGAEGSSGSGPRTVDAPRAPVPCRAAAQPQPAHVQSLSLTAERLLSCQPDAVTVFSIASGGSTRLPFAFPVHSLSAEQAATQPMQTAHAQAAGAAASTGSPCFSALSCSGEVLSLCTQQAVIVYNAQRALSDAGFAVSQPRADCQQPSTGSRRRARRA